MMRTLAIIALLLLLLANCGNDDHPPPSPPATSAWVIGPIVNGTNYSVGMPLYPTHLPDDSTIFGFPVAPGHVDYVTRRVYESARNAVHMDFAVDVAGQLVPMDGNLPARVRLVLMRAGDNWSGTGGYENYRFWSAPIELSIGTFAFDVPLTADLWTNVNGHRSGHRLRRQMLRLDRQQRSDKHIGRLVVGRRCR